MGSGFRRGPYLGKTPVAGEALENLPEEGRMGTDNPKKCAQPNCSCTAMAGKYCSVQCETMDKMPDIECKCGHPVCKAK